MENSVEVSYAGIKGDDSRANENAVYRKSRILKSKAMSMVGLQRYLWAGDPGHLPSFKMNY